MAKRTSQWKHGKVAVLLVCTLLLFAGWNAATIPVRGPHSSLDLLMLRGERSTEDGLYVMYSRYFATAGRCSGCHGHDTLGLAMVDEEGTDVNVADDWRSTMMANSARDPFFRAKLSHEVIVNPGHQVDIESKCLSCHAPLGMHEERMLGNPPFTAAMLDTSVMGLEGVSCLACHQQNPDSAGRYFSGGLHFDSAKVWGPYADEDINAAIMEFFVGFRPGFAEHIIDGRVCAGCHTLLTETVDLSGNFTGGQFVEQATWHEWKNSIYQADSNTTCRGCHMPRIQDEVVLASEYAFLQGHSPFGLHYLTGGNTMMLRLLKEHAEELGIPATNVQFDSTIARTLRNLHNSVDLDVVLTERTNDTAFVEARLVNLVGHKFPSGYPSRRAFVRVFALDADGDTLFQSGAWDGTNELVGHDATYEPHYDVITQPDQVQIYEMVMGDVNGDVTTVLERAASTIKDNRLVPQGFSVSHYAYDTTRIESVPGSDIDFNHDLFGIEGNGGDIAERIRGCAHRACPRVLPTRAAQVERGDVQRAQRGDRHVPHHVRQCGRHPGTGRYRFAVRQQHELSGGCPEGSAYRSEPDTRRLRDHNWRARGRCGRLRFDRQARALRPRTPGRCDASAAARRARHLSPARAVRPAATLDARGARVTWRSRSLRCTSTRSSRSEGSACRRPAQRTAGSNMTAVGCWWT
jgi:Cytochrome c554 and c-prime